jgi:hypothetical protein
MVVTPWQFSAALLDGAALAVLFVVVVALLHRHRRALLWGALIVACLVYVGFALDARAGAAWVAIELLGAAAYAAIGWIGVRGPAWWLAAAWALHPVWDVGLHYFGPGRGFAPPLSYAVPCLSFDLLVAGYAACRR